jgi:phage tail sheath protein FI
VDAYVNDTLGRSEFAAVSFPSYGWVADPEATEPGKLKLVTLTGQIHGREARIANDWLGYHKAGAGVDASLPSVLKLTTEDAILNEEYLNPKGINVIKKVKGRFVLWGDRTLWSDPAWKWKHQREQMSYYEQVLIESFDWIVFAINDPVTEKPALTALKGFFLPEFQKRALRGKSIDDAAIIKLDSEVNTDSTRAAGDMFAEINLALADTVERFIMKIGKQGLFESVG